MSTTQAPDAPKTLHIVDGSAYIYRAFYAIRRLSNSKGMATNALYGFVQMLKKLIEVEDPQYLAMTFDRYDEEDQGISFRHEMYAEYKANRDEMPDDLKVQVPYFERIVEAMNIPVLIQSGVEADDVIATLTRHAREAGLEVCIVSADKDLMQLVSEHVRMIDTMRGKTFTPEEVEARFGVPPEKVKYVLALAGDTSDNVPGVPGIGEKTGGQLITEFGDLENLLANIDKVSGTKRKENLTTYADQARLSLELVTLRDDCDVDFNLEALKLSPPDYQALADVLNELEFHAMYRAMVSWYRSRGLVHQQVPSSQQVQPKSQATKTIGDEDPHGQQLLFGGLTPTGGAISAVALAKEAMEQHKIQKNYRAIMTEAELDEVIEALNKSARFAFDLETTSLDAMSADIVGFALAWEADAAVYIPTGHTYEGAPKQLPLQLVLDKLRPLLEQGAPKLVGQHTKYEWLVLMRYGIDLKTIAYDTLLMGYLLDASRITQSLDVLALHYLGYKTITFEDVAGKGKKQLSFDQIELEAAVNYAAEDADVTLRLCEVMLPLLQKEELEQLHDTLELPLSRVLAKMERAGICIDSDILGELSLEFDAELESLQQRIDVYSPTQGESINPNSPKQLREVLFEHLDLPTKKQTKSGASTDQSVLEQLAPMHPLPELILEYRQYAKLKGTYVDALPELVHPDTGRIHTSFNQAIAATGRLSSSNPNLQNIPVRTDNGRQIRKAFVPRKGWTLLVADYSQIELRIMAHMADDPIMIASYQNDEDIHARTAANIFDVPLEEVTSDQRRAGKTINFGVLYGMGAQRLANALKISVSQAKTYIEQYFERYSAVQAFFDRTVEHARATGEVNTMFGRVRPIPEINAGGGQRAFAERVAMNTPIQGTAADIIKMAMIAIDLELMENQLPIQMLLQVHDELVFEVEPDAIDEARALVTTLMEGVCELKAPLKVESGQGLNWLDAK